jgi:ribosomal protein S18 acetylase RimI-like enzyme
MKRISLDRRAATDKDTKFARTAHHLAYHDVVVRQFGMWDEQAQDVFFNNDWHPNRCEIVLWDGQPCGYISVEKHEDCIDVRELVIVPQFQGRGIGTWVIRAAMDSGRASNLPVKLGALHSNRAIELYRRLGFQATERTSTYTLFIWQSNDSALPLK